MLGFFERQRLVKKGLASSKVRRRRTESELLQTLEHGFAAKLLMFALFVVALCSLIYWGTENYWGEGYRPTEPGLIGVLIFLTAIAQLWIGHPNTWTRNSRLLACFTMLLVHLTAVKIILLMVDAQIGRTSVVSPGEFSALERQQLWRMAIPFGLAPITLSVLLGRNLGLFAATFVSLWGALMHKTLDAEFLVISLISGYVGVFLTFKVRRRDQLVRAGFLVGVTMWLMGIIFGWIGPFNREFLETVGTTNWSLVGWQTLISIGGSVVLAFVISGGIIPGLEMLFRITTDMRWLELQDLNHPLLKRMMIEAPGTYQHSLVVANLAEAACESIGANAIKARVGSYFHDIGKLVKPDYFTENMRHDRNPHDDLAPTMSALIIIAHVKEGVDLALKHGLNQEIIDIIQQHHGTSMVFYFYKRALQQQEDQRAGGKIMNIREEDIPDVREESFRYSGPKPQSREAAVIMLADSIESAARSLERVTPHKIDQLITDIIEKKLVDGQLKDCDLTMRELEVLAESFKFTMQSMMHSRVAYPSDKTPTGETKTGTQKSERPENPAASRSRPPMTAA